MIRWRHVLWGILVIVGLQTAAHAAPWGNSAGQRKALCGAIKAENVERVRKLLANGVNVNEDFLSRIPLHDAVYSGNETIIEMLIEAGADVNRQDGDGRTALQMYVGYADKYRENAKEASVVKLLVAHGARVDVKGRQGSSPIDVAMSINRPDLVTILLDKVPNITIHQAAYLGRWEKIQSLLEQGADINEADKEGCTPLYYAACLGDHVDVVRRLIERGARVDLGSPAFTPLYGAVCYSHYDVAKVLIDNGADVNARQDEGMTPLHFAIQSSYDQNPKDIVEYLLDHGARMDLKDDQGYTSLDVVLGGYRSDMVAVFLSRIREKTVYEAARVGQWDRVESLLNAGTGIGERDRFGCTALFHAAWGDQLEVVERLIAKGADVDAATKGGFTPLHIAAMRGYPRIGELLLRHGASIDLKDRSGETPLYKAASGYTQEGAWPYDLRRSEELDDVVELLLANGADVNCTTNDQNDTPLHKAARFCNLDTARLLIQHGADVNAKDSHGRTPLLSFIPDHEDRLTIARAIEHQQGTSVEGSVKAMTELMLAEGADVDARDEQGGTLLHYATQFGLFDVVRILLHRGAEVNARDHRGRTPLLVYGNLVLSMKEPAGVDHLETIKLLIAHGADVNAQDDTGHSALALALKDKDRDRARVLIEQGADVNAVTDPGWSPLHLAIEESGEEMALLLIDRGANIRTPVRQHVFDSLHGSTPLHLAAQRGYIRVASVLIERGADLNAVNDSGQTPLHVAIRWSNENVALLLIAKGANIYASINQTSEKWLMGATSLHLTAREGCILTASALIEKGANVNAVDGDGATTAHLAIRYNHPELLELLLRNGANIHLADKAGDTLLRAAARRYRPNPNIISGLVGRGATITPTIRSLLDHGKTQLQLAVEANDIPGIVALTKTEYFTEQINLRCHGIPNSPGPLATAISKGYTVAAKLLIQHGANVNETVSADQSLLFHAARDNKTAIAHMLIEGGANVNQVDMFEETPLHMAAWCGYAAMVELLLKNGANVNAVMRMKVAIMGNNAGFTPLHNAALGRRAEVVKVLIAHGADVNAKDAHGLTPLDQAVMQKDVATIGILKAAGARGRSELDPGQGPAPVEFFPSDE